MSASQLKDDWGHWALAVQAASGILGLGGKARVGRRRSDNRGPWKATDGPQDVLCAIRRAHRDLGDWPTEWEFEVYIDLQRRFAREHPQRFANRALPSPLEIRATFGSYDRARELAQWAVGAPLADVMREVERVVVTGRRRPPRAR